MGYWCYTWRISPISYHASPPPLLSDPVSCSYTWEAAGDGSNTEVSATYLGDPDGVLGFWLQFGLALAAVVLWVREAAGGRSLFLPLFMYVRISLSHSPLVLCCVPICDSREFFDEKMEAWRLAIL